MKIEEGKYYRTRDGEKVGPMRPEAGHWHISDGRLWSDEGKRWSRNNSHNDIVSEWVEDQKFKIGDRVVVVENSRNCDFLDEYVGRQFVIKDKDEGDGSGNCWSFDGNHFWWPECDLKHAATTPAIVALVENGQPKPSSHPVLHNTEEDAKREADRLAANNQGKEFVVFTKTYSAKQEKTYDHEWQRLAARGDKIGAVRELRSLSSLDLRSAKNAVETFMEKI